MVYKDYMAAVGWWTVTGILVLYAASNAFVVGSSVWLSEWSDDALYNGSMSPEMRVLGYAGLGIAQCKLEISVTKRFHELQCFYLDVLLLFQLCSLCSAVYSWPMVWSWPVVTCIRRCYEICCALQWASTMSLPWVALLIVLARYALFCNPQFPLSNLLFAMFYASCNSFACNSSSSSSMQQHHVCLELECCILIKEYRVYTQVTFLILGCGHNR